MRNRSRLSFFAVFLLLVPFVLFAQREAPRKPRARDLGVPFDGTPGKFNAITDVSGVLVGHTTLVSGEGKLQIGKGPVRTGVTAVLPRGKNSMNDAVFAGWFSQNGNGEMTGTTWVEESGFLEGPVMITNTHSVGVVRDARRPHRSRRHCGRRRSRRRDSVARRPRPARPYRLLVVATCCR